ncbi:hypothetical protein NLI96_g615 [Meripilus lineatus]|uniref:F-box domain-containing protein n=1 Tax=Meripilus lineatus TaxID=2056292 RepID=A0AAD5VE24_9APHY|nr:hypothetical protein NLI96_g615 [Physisporinus lineatus]
MDAIPRASGSLPFHEDILHIVIGKLCDDKLSLSRISLVSKPLMAIARRHLFRTITVRGMNTAPKPGFPEFKHFLSSSRGTSYLIQNVSLIGEICGCCVDTPSLDYHLLGQILSNLPSLRKLELDIIYWEGRIDEDQDDSKIHTYPPIPLHHLSITGSSVKGDEEGLTGKQNLFNLFTLFSTIDTFRVSHIDIPGRHLYSSLIHRSERQKMEIPPYFQVRSLICDARPDLYVLEAIRKSGSFDTLKHVSLQWYSWDDLAAVGAFLRDVGQGIEDVSFTPERTFWQTEELRDHQYRYDSDGLLPFSISYQVHITEMFSTTPAVGYHIPDLAPCSSLRSLRIELHICDEFSENMHWQDTFKFLARMLNTVTRPMEQFYICFEVWPLRCPEAHTIFSDMPWLLLEDALCKFPGLNGVVLEISIKRVKGEPTQIDEVQTDLAFLERVFPRLHQKSILLLRYRESAVHEYDINGYLFD